MNKTTSSPLNNVITIDDERIKKSQWAPPLVEQIVIEPINAVH
jgi:hypothetical protein